MASFSSYMAPSVTTDVVYEEGGVTLYGDTQILVLIGEGAESVTQVGVEMHRGSSAVADDLRVAEPLTAQVDGVTRVFQLTYFPVVTGDGTGTITNDPTAVTLYTMDDQLNKIPLRVTSLNGSTGKVTVADLLLKGSVLNGSYYFKRTDTLVKNEDLSDQVPGFASFVAQGVTLSLTKPGYAGNNVSLAFTLGSTGVSDVLAVSGQGSDVLSIELCKSDGSIRTNYDLANLIAAGIPTASGGSLTYVGPTTGANIVLAAAASTKFSGGSGQNTNTTFKLKNVPVVDGTNGGVVTNQPSKITVLVNGSPASVTSLDGTTGLFTLASGVKKGAKFTVSYYTNTYQDTFDILPVSNAVSLPRAGYAPGRSDFASGTDFLLGDDNKIYWGNASLAVAGVSTPGAVPFDSTAITTSLADERVFLHECAGVVDGVNTVFQLGDVPVDGSGLGTPTDDPKLVRVYVGKDPLSAYEMGAVRVVRLDGSAASFTLYNPPAASTASSVNKVFATYWRNTIGNHEFTLTVKDPGVTGHGSYTVTSAEGNLAPSFTEGSHSIADANAAVTGLVWPASKSDIRGVAGKTPTETITLTFQNDGASVSVQAIQAGNATACPGVLFQATTPGIAPNSANPASPDTDKPVIQLVSQAAVSDANAIVVTGETIAININRDTTDLSTQTRTLGEIVDLVNSGSFTDASNYLGGLTASLLTGWEPTQKASAGTATGFTGGAAAVTVNASTHFKVTSSRTAADKAADGLGITGGATTSTDVTLGTDGYLNQTFVDPNTGVQFTLVDPALALETNAEAATDYGFTTTPSPVYHFAAGDKVVIEVTGDGVQVTAADANLSVYGLKLHVPSTYGMAPGDTLVVKTHGRAGSTPAVGDYYYLDIVTKKSDAELATITYYTDESKLIYDRGEILPENKLSLGGHLAFLNGATLIGVRQVKRETGSLLASDAAFIDAIADLKKPLPGQNRKANLIVPLSTSKTVINYLAQHLHTQSSPRNKGEAVGYVGLPLTATHTTASELAPALNSERVVLLYPGGGVVTLNVNDTSMDYAVGGEFLAASLAGLYLNSANDVATDLSLQKLSGWKSLISQTEEPIMDMLAQAGVTVLQQTPGGIEIRQHVTTSTDSVLMIEPYVTTTVDFVRQRTRTALKEFIGKKNLKNRKTDISSKLNALMAQFVSDEILTSYKPATVSDTSDPRALAVSVSIRPMFSTLWINVTFKVSSKQQ